MKLWSALLQKTSRTMDNDRSPETQHAKKIQYGLLCSVAQFQAQIYLCLSVS